MAINYAKLFNRRVTPQSQPIPGSTQVRNSNGGYSWQVDDWTRLDRFLILGAEGGTYYIGERELVKQNHDALIRCIKADGVRAVNRIVEISDAGRAPKNDPAIFALALVVTHGDVPAKAHAFANLGKVCRIGTHLFHFAEYVNAMRGWGRGLRNAVGRWYVDREADDLAHQAVKYQQRDGWSHGDLLRLAHPKAPFVQHDAVFRWMLSGAEALGEREVKRKVRGEDRVASMPPAGEAAEVHRSLRAVKKASTNVIEIVKLIDEFDLPREAIPTQWLNEGRGLGSLARTHADDGDDPQPRQDDEPRPAEAVQRRKASHRPQAARRDGAQACPHPPAGGPRGAEDLRPGSRRQGALKWSPVSEVVDALDEAFYATFQNVEPCGKPVLLALDVSGSMAAR
jgi:60 kDa SS-A/Ro ribonucleoprotein